MSRGARLLLTMAAATFSVLAFAGNQSPSPSAGAEVLMQADRDFAKATAERRLQGWLEYFAEDGVSLANQPAVGREAIRAAFKPLFDNPSFRLEWAPVKAGILPSGTVGYTEGRATSYRTGPRGEELVQHSSYVTVWKKQADGSWKVVFDTGAPDPTKN